MSKGADGRPGPSDTEPGTSWLRRGLSTVASRLTQAQQWLPPGWRSRAAILEHRRIPDTLWQNTLALYPFLQWRDALQQHRLRELSTLFLAHKQFVPAGGLALTDDIAVAIAAQACLPALRLGLACYDGLGDIVIHPDQVVAQREVMDEAGVVHHYDEVLAGEAMPGGPIMLSWQDVQQAQDTSLGYNVVVHEFVHALDMLNGEVDGIPPLPPDISTHEWTDTLWQAFDHHSETLARGHDTWLDPYALDAGLVEFFPVVVESFFVAPQRLQAAHPAVYGLLMRYFQDDPARWAPPSADELAAG